MDKRVPDDGTLLTKKRSLAIELQADVAICSTGRPKQTIQGTEGVMHCKKKRGKRTMISSTVKQTWRYEIHQGIASPSEQSQQGDSLDKLDLADESAFCKKRPKYQLRLSRKWYSPKG